MSLLDFPAKASIFCISMRVERLMYRVLYSPTVAFLKTIRAGELDSDASALWRTGKVKQGVK